LWEEDRAVRALAGKQHGVIGAAQAHRLGIAEPGVRLRVARGEWRELFRGVYLVAPELVAPVHSASGHVAPGHVAGEGLPRRTVISAGLLAAGPQAVAVLRTAAELLGLPRPDADPTVHVTVPGMAARHNQDGLVIHQLQLPRQFRTRVDGLSCTNALRTVADSVCHLRRWDAVSLVDAALHHGRISAADLVAITRMIARRPGCVGGRRHLAEADGRAQSPAATRVRLICKDAKLAPDALQHPMRDGDGVLLGHAHLAWLRAMVAVEVAGPEPQARAEELIRERFRRPEPVAGEWRVIRFSWADTFRAEYVRSTVRTALAGRAGRA
jgi:hypothetical protein